MKQCYIVQIGLNRIIRKRSLQFQVVCKMLQVDGPGFFQSGSRLRANLPTFTEINIQIMKSKNNLTRFILLLNLILLASCSGSIKVSSYKTPDVNLSNYKTYAWIAPGDTALNSRRDDKVYAGFIQHTADAELKKKGMTIDNKDPDAVIIFDTKIMEHTELRQTPVVTGSMGYGGYGYGYTGAGYYAGGSAPIYGGGLASISVEEGNLMYTLYDRKTGNLLWRASGTQTLTAKTNIEKTIKKATNFIFAKLPIKHKAPK